MPLIYIGTTSSQDYLAHHGILGQKWGVRRFQNPDGSLTAEGRERYGVDRKSMSKGLNDLDQQRAYSYAKYDMANKRSSKAQKRMEKRSAKIGSNAAKTDEKYSKYLSEYNTSEQQKRDAEKRMAVIDKEISRMLREADKSGYWVRTRATNRAYFEPGDMFSKEVMSLVGREMLANVALNAALLPLGGMAFASYSPYVSGTKYSVREKKK